MAQWSIRLDFPSKEEAVAWFRHYRQNTEQQTIALYEADGLDFRKTGTTPGRTLVIRREGDRPRGKVA